MLLLKELTRYIIKCKRENTYIIPIQMIWMQVIMNVVVFLLFMFSSVVSYSRYSRYSHKLIPTCSSIMLSLLLLGKTPI